MRLRKHVPLIESTLKRVALRPVSSSLCTRCRRCASSQAYPEKVAVLGGGISGLASAYFVAKEFPKSKITIYEANPDSGGWIQSRRVQTPTGDVLFEYGARTLRPGSNALITAQLVSTKIREPANWLTRARFKIWVLQTVSSSLKRVRPAQRTATYTIPIDSNAFPPQETYPTSGTLLNCGHLAYLPVRLLGFFSNRFGRNDPTL